MLHSWGACAYLECRPRKRKIYTVDPYSSLTCRFHIFSESRCVKPPHKVGDKRLIVKNPEDPGAFWRSCTTIFPLIQVGNIRNAKDISVPSFWNLLLRWLEEALKKSNSWKIILAKWCYTAPTPALQVQVHQRIGTAVVVHNSRTLTIPRHMIIIYPVQVCKAKNKMEERLLSKRLYRKWELLCQLDVVEFKRRQCAKRDNHRTSTKSRCHLRQPQRVFIRYFWTSANFSWESFFCAWLWWQLTWLTASASLNHSRHIQV